MAIWSKAMKDDWRACRDWLARRHPDRWSERQATRRANAAAHPEAPPARRGEFRLPLDDPEFRDFANRYLAQLAADTTVERHSRSGDLIVREPY